MTYGGVTPLNGARVSSVGPKPPLPPALARLLPLARAGDLHARKSLKSAGVEAAQALADHRFGALQQTSFVYARGEEAATNTSNILAVRTWCPLPNLFGGDAASTLSLLTEAPMTRLGPIGIGNNRPERVRLEASGGPGIEAVLKRESTEIAAWRSAFGPLAVREAAVYALDLALGLGAVPPTVLRTLPDGDRASLQLFVPNTVSGPMVVPRGTLPFDKLRLFDVIIGSRDRSGLNCLYVSGAGGLLPLAIDNGNCLQRTGQFDARQLSGGPVLAAAVEWLQGIDPTLVAQVLADAGIERNAVEDAVRRLLALQAQPQLMSTRDPMNAATEEIALHVDRAFGGPA